MSKNINVYILLESNYETFIRKSRPYKTCSSKYRISQRPNFDEAKCMKLCTDEVRCSFFYINNGGWCVTYAMCDELRVPHMLGTTFKMKKGNINCLELK